MAEVIGRPRIELEADPKGVQAGLDAAVQAFKNAEAKIESEQRKMEKAQERVGRAIQQSMDRINAVKPTAQLQIISQALDKLGGTARLTDTQIAKLAVDVERLAAAGGRVPKNLQGLTLPSGGGGLGPAAAQLEAQARTLASSLGPAGAAISALGPAGLAAAAGVGAATLTLSKFVSYTSAIADLADKTQLSSTFLQELGFAGSLSGVSMEDAAQAALLLSRNIGDGSKVFEKLGLDLKELKTLSPDEQFRRVAEAIRDVQDPAEQTSLAMAAFGRSGAAILPILRQGFAAAADEAHRLNLVLGEDAVQRGDRLGDSWERLTRRAGALTLGLGDLAAQLIFTAGAISQGLPGIAQLDSELNPKKAAPKPPAPTQVEGFDISDSKSIDEFIDKNEQLKALIEDNRKALSKAAAEAEAAAKREAAAFDAVFESLTDLGRAEVEAQKLSLIDTVINSIGGSSNLSAEEVVRFTDAMKKLGPVGTQAAAGLQAAADQAAGVFQIPVGSFNFDQLAEGADPLIEKAHQIGIQFQESQKEADELRAAVDVAFQQGLIPAAEYDRLLHVVDESTSEVTKTTISWAAALANVAHQFELTGRVGSTVGQILGGGAGIGSLFEKGGIFGNGGIKFGTLGLESGASFAKNFGSAVSAIGGYAQAAFAAFDVGKAIFDLFHKSPAERAAERVGRDLGVAISKNLAEAIGADAEKINSEVGAVLLHLSDIIDEAGGVAAFGFDKAVSSAHDLFSQIETGTLTTEQAGTEFDRVFSQLIPEAIDKSTGLAKQSFLDLIELNKRFGTESQAVAGFLRQQSDAVAAGLQAVATGAVVTEESAAGLGAAVAAAFQQLRDAGASPQEALGQLQSTIEGLKEKFKDAGVDGGAAFNGLAAQSALLSDEVAGPLIGAIDGAAQALVGLANSNALTPEIFAGLTQTIGDTFDKLVQEGKGGSAALALIAPDLQKVWELQHRFGFAVDESTQNLIDQGVAAGLVGEEHESAAERMVTATERVGDILTAIAEQMGVDLPKAAQDAADGVNKGLDDIRDRDVNINYHYHGDPPPGAPGGNPRGGGGGGREADIQFDAGLDAGPGGTLNFQQFARGLDEGPVRRTGLVFAHEGEFVVRRDQLGGNVTNIVDVGGITVVAQPGQSPQEIAEAVTRALEARTVPRLETAIRERMGLRR